MKRSIYRRTLILVLPCLLLVSSPLLHGQMKRGGAQPAGSSSWNPFSAKDNQAENKPVQGTQAYPAAPAPVYQQPAAPQAGYAPAPAATPAYQQPQPEAQAYPAAPAPVYQQPQPGAQAHSAAPAPAYQQPNAAAPHTQDQSIQAVMARIVQMKAVAKQEQERTGLLAFEQGLMLYKEQKFAQALKCLEKAKLLLPANPDVDAYLASSKSSLGGRGGEEVAAYTNWIGENKSVQEQELLLKIKNHIRAGSDLTAEASGEWDAAQQESGDKTQATLKLKKARVEYRNAMDAAMWVGVGTDVSAQKEEIRQGISDLDVLEAQWTAQLENEKKQKAKITALDLAQEQKNYENAKRNRLFMQAKRDFLNGHYDKSEDLSRRILSEWPTDKEARKLLDKSRDRRDTQTEKYIEQRSAEEWTKNKEYIEKASIPYADELTYPKYWDKIRRRQPQTVRKVGEPEWMRLLKTRMLTPVQLTLVDNSLQEAIQILQDQTGINIQVDRNLMLDDARIETLRIRDVKFSAAIKWLLNSLPPGEEKLIYTLQDGAVFITSKSRAAQFTRPEQVLYDVMDLITAFQDFTLQGGGAGAGGLYIKRGEELSGVGEGEAKQSLDGAGLIEVIKGNVDTASWVEENGISIYEFEIGKLLISQTPDNHKAIEELLEMFRKLQTMQISIEARFISSQEDDLLDLGVEWHGLDEVPLEDSGVTNTGAGFYSKRSNLNSDSRGAVILGSAGDGITKGQRYIPGIASDTGGIMQVSILDPIRAALALHALSEKKKLKDILAPRLTVLNNHQGYIIRAEDRSYVASYQNDGGSLRPTIERISTGELLVVRPTVSSDKKYITMDLSPQITRNVDFTSRAMRFSVTQTGLGGNLPLIDLVDADLELPNIEIWQVQTRVQMPDGGVIFIGGRMGNKETNISRGVPVISKIPLLGRLFRTDAVGSELDNLLISVRAKILLFEEYEARL